MQFFIRKDNMNIILTELINKIRFTIKYIFRKEVKKNLNINTVLIKFNYQINQCRIR
jgi:hypothetical protein